MKRWIIAASLFVLMQSGMMATVNAAAPQTFPVRFSFYDPDSYAPSTPAGEDGAPKGVKQIAEGKATIYDEEGDTVASFNLDGKSRTYDMEAGKYYKVEIDFSDTSPYFDTTADAYVPVDPDFPTPYIPIVSYVKARHILPQAVDAQDGTALTDCVFRVTDQESGKDWDISTDWNEEDISNLPVLSPGAYTVSSVKIPDGYYFDGSQEIILEPSDDESAYKTYAEFRIGRQSGRMDLTVKNEDEEPIEGAVFLLTNETSKESYDPMSTDKDGKISLWDLPLGTFQNGKLTKYDTYSIKTLSLPKQYEENELQEVKFTFEKDTTKEESFLIKEETLTFHKTEEDPSDGEAIEGGTSSKNEETAGGSGQADGQGEQTSSQSKNAKESAARTGDTINILFVLALFEGSILTLLKRKEALGL